MNAIAKRIKRLENLEVQQQAQLGPDFVAQILERRRKRAIAEGREAELERLPERLPQRFLDNRGRRFSLADVILQRRKRRLLKQSIESLRSGNRSA